LRSNRRSRSFLDINKKPQIAARAFSLLLLICAILLVGWIRLLPLQLGSIDDYARELDQKSERFKVSPGAQQQIAAGIKAQLEYVGDDRRTHVLLGDADSYYWLRLARNLENRATVCDSIVNRRCWDAFGEAPSGRANRYRYSLHVYSIAGLHWLMNRFTPGYPLPASAFLVPVIVGMLGTIPAFLLGARLGGNLGGLASALIIGLNPLFLQRSIGSDNDVWNVVLPLFILWLVVKALEADRSWHRIAWSVAGGLTIGIFAGTWRGWIFTYYVIAGGLTIALLVDVLRSQHRNEPSLRPRDRRIVSIVLALFCLSGGIAAATVTGEVSSVISDPLQSLPDGGFGITRSASDRKSLLPDALSGNDETNVEELRSTNLQSIAKAFGGMTLFAIGVAGLLSLAWRTIWRAPWPRDAARGEAASDVLSCTLAIWFIAGYGISLAGVRFILLLLPASGLGVAASIGAIQGAISERCGKLSDALNLIVRSVSTAGMLTLLTFPVYDGYAGARAYIPAITSEWWTSLSKLKAESPPQAIIVSWWDYGYWTEYIAERRTVDDGGSVRTHAPYWTAKSLLAPSDAQSIGLLRMLECGGGGDTDSAFGKLRAYGMNDIGASDTLLALAVLDRAAAREYLEKVGLAPPAIDDVLALTHCVPPPSYLVLSSSMIDMPAWRRMGNWDLHRSKPDAASGDGYFSERWLPCFDVGNGTAECPMENLRDVPLGQGASLHTIVIRSGPHPSAMLRLLSSRDRRGTITTYETPPGATIVASGNALTEYHNFKADYPDVAVLYDADRKRALAGPSNLVRSTFTRLMFLGPGYSPSFGKVDDQWGYGGERVIVWDIHFDSSMRLPCPSQTSGAERNAAGNPKFQGQAGYNP